MSSDAEESQSVSLQLPDENWRELMAKVQQGDNVAYRDLLNDITPVLKGYIQNRVGYLGVTDDLVQDILISIHKSRHNYDATRSFSTWMFAISKNRMIDYLRKVGRQSLRETKSEEALRVAHAPAIDASQEIINQNLYEALDTLPAPQREAVQLLKIDGLSVKEASEKLGVSSAALRVRAHRAYVALRKILERSEYDE